MRNRHIPETFWTGIPIEKERSARADQLAMLHEPAEIADYLRAERDILIARIKDGARLNPQERSAQLGGTMIAREFSDLMDAVIARMFTLACRKVGENPNLLPVVIVATGGYGRRELSPYSDIDITFIPHNDNDPHVDRVIRQMFTQVMDVCIARCGLEVGYAYRLMEDCGTLDHQTVSGLLDARVVAGSDRLFIQFEDAFWMGFNPADFIFTKVEERDRMLAKWGRTPRVVEPQLKEGPGGLRDIHTAVWLVQARENLAAARVRGERAFEILLREANVLATDAALLVEAKELLFRVRNVLHAIAGTHRDELVITRQEEVASLLGYDAGPVPSDAAVYAHDLSHAFLREAESPEAPPVERFMADLYAAMALVRRVSSQVIRRIENSRLILGIGLDCRRKQIVPANDALESDDPAWLLWACELSQLYNLELGEGLEHAAVALVEMNPLIADASQSSQVFSRILSRLGKIYPTLQRMADLGILGWFVPEFGRLMNLIPYDPSHDHTVGQHTLLVLYQLEALLTQEGNEEMGEMRRVLEELPHPEQLALAVLLHDSGKAIPGRPHAEIGDEIAQVVCRRLGWSAEAMDNVRFLIRQHLLMAETSRLRDLNLDETIRDFTRVVDDIDRLNMLYLLTYADTRAVGEGVWTQVKGRFLRDLWRRSVAALSDEEPLGHDDAALARTRHRLLKDLSLENLPEVEVTEHIEAMPAEYLLNQTLKQIGLHIGFVRRVRAGEIVIDFHDERDATYTELTVSAYDDPQPGLLAKIAGALYAAGLDIHSTQVITRVTDKDRIALDTLWVDFRGRQLSPGKRREITANLEAVLTGVQTVDDLLKKKRATVLANEAGRTGMQKPISIRAVRNDISDTLTVIEAGGPDIHGIFYRVCDALSRLGWDIRSAKASTWQGESLSSFYVAGAHHLSEEEIRAAFARVLPTRVSAR